MNFHILTLFPEMIVDGLSTSITGRAMEKGVITVDAVNIRDFTTEKHGHVDDYPYGGGAGMVMQPDPIYRAYEHVIDSIKLRHKADIEQREDMGQREDMEQREDMGQHEGKEQREYAVQSEVDLSQEENLQTKRKTKVIYMTPQGKVFNQNMARELAKEEDLIFLCGHYEGIDERVLEMIVTDNVSIGDYVLTGGELPAMVMIDAISRLVPGVLGNDVSSESESFSDNLLEYPQYTRPYEYMEKKVPDVLLSGHHKNIEKWRLEQSIERTKERRPDLWEKYESINQRG